MNSLLIDQLKDPRISYDERFADNVFVDDFFVSLQLLGTRNIADSQRSVLCIFAHRMVFSIGLAHFPIGRWIVQAAQRVSVSSILDANRTNGIECLLSSSCYYNCTCQRPKAANLVWTFPAGELNYSKLNYSFDFIFRLFFSVSKLLGRRFADTFDINRPSFDRRTTLHANWKDFVKEIWLIDKNSAINVKKFINIWCAWELSVELKPKLIT